MCHVNTDNGALERSPSLPITELDQTKAIDRIHSDEREPGFPPGADPELISTHARRLKGCCCVSRHGNRFHGGSSGGLQDNSGVSGVNGVWLAAPRCAAAVTVHSCQDREDSQDRCRAAKLKMSPAIFGTAPLYHQNARLGSNVVLGGVFFFLQTNKFRMCS